MKIANKISFLIVALFIVLGINTYVGLTQLMKIGYELDDVANEDVALTEVITSFHQIQLEKGILFERMLRISEELAFEEMSKGRQEHLLFQAQLIKEGFAQYTQKSARDIMRGHEIISMRLGKAHDEETYNELNQADQFLTRIEKAHIKHAEVVSNIFNLINEKNYELSFEDIDRVHIDERRLSREMQKLLEEVQGFTKKSLRIAEEEKELAKDMLLFSTGLSIVIASLFMFFLIQSISRPLKGLTNAAHKIGEGNFDIHFEKYSNDEIGEVSQAFDSMSTKLDEAQKELENKNEELAQSLEITKEQKSDLEKVNQELDRFVHTVSHDIGAPLRGIAWYGESLRKNFFEKFDKKGKESLDGVCDGVKRLNTMVSDLLALSRIARIKNPYEVTNINTSVDEILKRIEFDIKQNNVDCRVQENMPEIVCDRIKVGELFYNLINNAIKFSSRENKNQPKVEIGYLDDGDFHQFFVKDNGIGIAPEYHDQIFGVFRRLNSSNKYEGSGVGLSIVKEIIEDHAGVVWIESKTSDGTVFHFTFPKSLSC